MKLKSISKLLIFGLLFNNFNLYSNANTLSEDTRYETFNGSNITIPDILEEDKVGMKLEGNTLSNIIKDMKGWSFHGNATFNSDTNSLTISNPTSYSKFSKTFNLKPNTEYTFFIKCDNNSDETVRSYFRHGDSDSSTGATLIGKTESNTTSLHKKTFRTNGTGIFTIGLEMGISNGSVMYYDAILVEGNYSDENIDYFNGLKSSFENNMVTQEMVDSGEEDSKNLRKYKIEYKTTGKNLIGNEVEPLGLNADTGEEQDDWTRFIRTGFIPVQNTQYVASYNYNNQENLYGLILCYDKDKQFIGTVGGGFSNIISFTPLFNTKYVRLRITLDSGTSADLNLLYSIQLEEGSVASTYEPYKESINAFYLDSPLLEGDTIEIINGQPTHIKRSEKILLDGSDDEKWQIWNPIETVDTIKFGITIENANKPNYYVLNNDRICNKFTTTLTPHNFSTSDIEGISSWDYRISIAIGINRDKLTTEDVKGFKEWLSINPITVVYKLENPIYEPIKANLSTNLFEETTHISNNSNTPARMTVIVDRALNRAVECTKLAKINPTIENISQARYWSNLIKDSTKKDLLQNEINNIANISDLEIEKKSASANVDLYIKSLNTLSMSLNTNSVTFNDFSGVEDMEKQNAVEITISSSLPYNLNAYLEGDIRNSDNTATIDKSIINIKDDTDSTYKAFDNNNKVILKDNCPEGNYSVHSIDLMLAGNIMQKKDVYKTVIKFEAEQR